MAGKKGVVLREFCAENLERVPSALDAGAGRIELCDNLAVGGTTPSLGVIEAAVDLCHARGARVMCMIRREVAALSIRRRRQRSWLAT